MADSCHICDIIKAFPTSSHVCVRSVCVSNRPGWAPRRGRRQSPLIRPPWDAERGEASLWLCDRSQQCGRRTTGARFVCSTLGKWVKVDVYLIRDRFTPTNQNKQVLFRFSCQHASPRLLLLQLQVFCVFILLSYISLFLVDSNR